MKNFKTNKCPECGSSDYVIETIFVEDNNQEHRICKDCTQEYFTDVDYSQDKGE